MTLNGLNKLEEERKKLKSTDRPNIIKAIAEARELGDLSENAEYHAAREQQGFIQGRIQELDDIISRAEVIDTSSIKSETIIFGATVHLLNLDSDEKQVYQIVGEHEADLEKKLISYTSPLGKALIGKKINDIIDIETSKKIISW